MKIVIAPDGFKGSLTAPEVCRALEVGVRRVWDEAEIVALPLADGGEGTLEALLSTTGGLLKTTRVQGPLGDPVEARWGILPNGKAIIEMAQASGLTLVAPNKRDAGRASSFGTGQLIKAALDAGCREIIVGVGGSATSDGGTGALTALGLWLRDKRNRALSAGGVALANLSAVDARFLDARLTQSKIVVLCDVSNPLLGTQGAARVYGPQKGALPATIEALDAGLQQWADVAAAVQNEDWSGQPGAGAAGGLAFGLIAFCGATLRSGIDFVLEANDFRTALENADLVLTGEGTLDNQTLSGKAVAGVCRLASLQNVPVIAFGGAVRLSGHEMDRLGLLSAFSLANGPLTLGECLENSFDLLSAAAERTLRIIKINGSNA